jgi:hypothetical protein
MCSLFLNIKYASASCICNANCESSQVRPVLRHGGPDTGVAKRLKLAQQDKCDSGSWAVYLRRVRIWSERFKS